MKLATLILTLLFSAIAHSAPEVGSQVKFTVTLQDGPFQQRYEESSVITAFDSSTEFFTVTETTLRPNYQPTIKSYQVSKDDSLKLANQYKECENLNGVWEKLELPMGEIDACAVKYDFDQEYGTVWFADIGFGVAKVVTYFKGLKAMRTRVLITTKQ